MNGHRHPHPRVSARELLQHKDVRQEIRTRPAVFLRHADAHQADRGELREDFRRKTVLAIPLCSVRRDLRVGELAGEPLDLLLLRGQLEIHGCASI